MREGDLGERHALAVQQHGTRIADPGARTAYELELLEETTGTGLSPQRLANRARVVAERHLAESAEQRHERARERRRVIVTPTDDGMCELYAELPAVIGEAISDRLTRIVRASDDVGADADDLATPADPRTHEQRRADIFAMLLLGSDTGAFTHVAGAEHGPAGLIRATIAATVPASALLGHIAPALDSAPHGAPARTTGWHSPLGRGARRRAGARTNGTGPDGDGPNGTGPDGDGPNGTGPVETVRDETVRDETERSETGPPSMIASRVPPAVLNGRTPIAASEVRQLLAIAPSFLRVFTDPVAGAVMTVDRRFPTAEQRAHLRVRDAHCRFPGCARPAGGADIDHTVAVQHGGRTSLDNLAHLCRRHHTLKHHSHWKVRQLPGGILEWRTPTGRLITDVPDVAGSTFRPTVAAAPPRARPHDHATTPRPHTVALPCDAASPNAESDPSTDPPSNLEAPSTDGPQREAPGATPPLRGNVDSLPSTECSPEEPAPF